MLAGIDLQVPAGQTVAVVGRTGSGKSTLLALIPRLIDPPHDALLVDGVDIRHLPMAKLRAAIGMVPQETFLFSATIHENIALGRPDAPVDQVLEAARLAGLDSDLASFPNGLDTLVGERGLTLSGGQKQRVTLARALLREPQHPAARRLPVGGRHRRPRSRSSATCAPSSAAAPSSWSRTGSRR